ncbi:uncharacterized protein LOC105382529 isoform X1 [Plutella xylostella]|uniref:uncharacterized protein LOC105382529 isoform X1 n=2 Tax=Plutella xylostella TaxID=51655 RepID=UPI0020323137|nr:uncharacterized protein LOC105382529 isoform X1 [Plutella xylostella]XP_011550731.2 uncharacterized protein LOC105382529 isoform X1 [Plutella xylostella]XP_037970817.2 uncharacterized protein LOC105382529 isoform X1 [Plutella xylostella]XP_048478759.1 uncharacterized protein LOC105382529 isoform X1 [Plutella xylostella]
MGVIHSLICSLTFCAERVLTWAVCACVLLVLMLTMVILLVYGISVGYHYAQKEINLWSYTAYKRKWMPYSRRSGLRSNGDEGEPAFSPGLDGQLPGTDGDLEAPLGYLTNLTNTSPGSGSTDEFKVKTAVTPTQDFTLRSTKNKPLWHKYMETKPPRTTTTVSPPSTERPPFNLYKLMNRFKRTEEEELTSTKPS